MENQGFLLQRYTTEFIVKFLTMVILSLSLFDARKPLYPIINENIHYT